MSLADNIENEKRTKATLELTPGGADIRNAVVESPIFSDWAPVLRLFNLDPETFEVVDDTVRMSSWEQSKRTDDGDRDTIRLYSYSARFRRLTTARLPQEDVDEHRAAIRKWRPTKPKRRDTSSEPVAAVVNLADVQSGKDENGGVAATRQRLLDGLDNVQAWLDRQRQHYNITELVIANNGDPIEGCGGNYASQTFSVELDTRGQMNFILDVWTTYAKTLYPQFGRGQFVSVLCNHGEFGRMGTNKNQTGDHDNAGGFLAETLQRILSDRPEFEHVEWTIPRDEMNVYPTIGGVPTGFCHGHKIAGNDATGFEKWLNAQVRGDDGAHAAKVWVTAHRHHFQAFDIGSASVFQCPSLDGGSKWLRDATGKYSRSGILAFLVGNHSPVNWSDVAFL